MRNILKNISCILLLLPALTVRAQDLFSISSVVQETNGTTVLRVAFTVPVNHFLYADKLSLKVGDDSSVTPFHLPEPTLVLDKFSGKQKRVYGRPFEATRSLPPARTGNLALTIRFQGCDEANCYFPEVKTFTISPDGSVAEVDSVVPTSAPNTTSE